MTDTPAHAAPPPLTRSPFWFMRHGETDWNRDSLIQGSTDVPLNAGGLAQAHAAVPLLANRGITAIHASPLQRARDTAQILATALDLPLTIDPSLREAAFGSQEGQVMGDWFTEWATGGAIPPGGEAFADLKIRAATAVNAVLALGGLPLIVAHGGFFRAVRAAMGLSATIRTANGVPLLCAPAATAWTLTQAEGAGDGRAI